MDPAAQVSTVGHSGESMWLEWRRITRLRSRDLKYIGQHLAADWFRHRVPRLGASLAFYTMLSLAPLLVVVLAVASFFFGREAATGQLEWQIRELVGPSGANAIQTVIEHASRGNAGVVATVLGVITLFFGASAVVAELRDALNTLWEVPEKPSQFGWRSVLGILKERTLSFAVVLAFGFLLLVSLAVNAVIAAMGSRFEAFVTTPEWLLEVVNLGISLLVITFVFGLLFRYMPDLEISWGDVLLGAFGTSILFNAGKYLIGLYLGKASVGSAYGAAGSLVIVLVWVYYSAQIFFLGAEFTQVYANCYGSQPREKARRKLNVVTPAAPRPDAHVELPGEVQPAKIEVVE